MSVTVDQILQRFTTVIQDISADADLAPGSVISELTLKLSAALHKEIYNDISDLSGLASVQDALAAAEDTYSPTIDKIASNYNVTRDSGKKSKGILRVVVSDNRSYSLQAGLSFLQPSLALTYVTEQDYEVSTSVTDGSLLLHADGASYYFLLPVTAESVGSSYQVSDKTKFDLSSDNTLVGFVIAEAYGNFTSGLPEETDKELISRFKLGLTNKSLTSTNSILANLKEQFYTLQDLSVVGAGDPELIRAKQNDFGIAMLGMADVYVRTTLGPETYQFSKSATKISAGIWEMLLSTTDAPGFYYVSSIFPQNTNLFGSLLVDSTTFGYSVEGSRVNTLHDVTEARFTSYQTATVRFEYNENPTVAIGSKQTFDISVRTQPDIANIQQEFLNDSTRVACTDYLVKSALPCFVSLSLKLFKKNASDVIPVSSIKQDIFEYINTIPFGEDLYVSKIVEICHKYQIKRVDLPLTVTGDILGNDGNSITITSSDALAIPDLLTQGISKRTTVFFTDYFKPSVTDNTTSVNAVDNIAIEVV